VTQCFEQDASIPYAPFVEALRAALPTVRVVDTGTNLGYAAAANCGIAATGTAVVAVCNPDARVEPGTARALIDQGAVVALATDFNPGSAFCESLPVVMSLACTQLGMSVAEALAATTVNAAWVLGRADRLGRLQPGFDADIVLVDAPDWRYVAYHLGGRDIAAVYKRGRRLRRH